MPKGFQFFFSGSPSSLMQALFSNTPGLISQGQIASAMPLVLVKWMHIFCIILSVLLDVVCKILCRFSQWFMTSENESEQSLQSQTYKYKQLGLIYFFRYIFLKSFKKLFPFKELFSGKRFWKKIWAIKNSMLKYKIRLLIFFREQGRTVPS